MKKTFLFTLLLLTLALVSCEKESDGSMPDDLPRTSVPAELRGTWMFGQFSMTEYWSQNPSSYMGNAFSIAMAFRFFENGTYEQYFTASVTGGGGNTFQQSVTKGTVEVNEATGTIKTHPYQSHYKRTRGTTVLEERDMRPSELKGGTYTYTRGREPNGTEAVYLTLQGTSEPLTFLSKP